jgi:hypothetical protein
MKIITTQDLISIYNSLENMSDEQYNQFKQYKYLKFDEGCSFIGGSHYEFSESPVPSLYIGKLYSIIPMGSRPRLLANLQYKIQNPEEQNRIKDSNISLTQEEIENYLFGEHSDSYNRLSRFYNIESKILPTEYVDIFRRVYSTTWKNYRYRSELRYTFSNKISPDEIMTEEETQIFHNLPEKLKIYRVMSLKEAESRDYGVSWTLDKDIAEGIAEMYFSQIYIQSGCRIKELEIDKTEITAYFDHANLKEVIYLPN